MSQQLPPFNPYDSPAPAYGQFAPPPPAKGKPGYLTFLCVLSIVLGCLGAGRGGCVAVSAAVGGGAPFKRDRAAEMPPELGESFRKMEAAGQAIDAKYSPFNKSMIIVQGLIGVAMIVGGYLLTQLKRPGDLVLRAAFVATVLVSLIHTGGFVVQMLEMQPMLEQFSNDVGQAGGEEAAAAGVLMMAMTGAMYGGLCAGVLWVVVKVGVLGHGFFYLGRPQVQSLLS